MKSHKSTIMERYDELGGSLYDIRYTEEQRAKYELILDEINEPDLLLDNGCGTGLLLPLLECTVVGLDLSSELLRKARERAKKNHHLIQSDSENLPLRNSIFYMVVSITVIQNLPNPDRLPSESARVAKPGSSIVISSLKRVYSKKEIAKLVESDGLCINKIFTRENINDWITVSTRKQ
ncbi:class I SAM-dependent methyltransferase [Candidatus Bathyarchaeota archaeon]|nr:class I SAM-dependent methyltransferase [Candidatus Bathyarchaeota archaeon]TFH15077.1 MAG: class I SAM-dependent methyltransferase [Candidatus Bathyarchaeota archaeon]